MKSVFVIGGGNARRGFWPTPRAFGSAEPNGPVEAPDPVAMIKHATEARGYRQKDLAAVTGSQPHGSEVLGRRRPLTLPMIRALSAEWKIPADVLVREYALAPSMPKILNCVE